MRNRSVLVMWMVGLLSTGQHIRYEISRGIILFIVSCNYQTLGLTHLSVLGILLCVASELLYSTPSHGRFFWGGQGYELHSTPLEIAV